MINIYDCFSPTILIIYRYFQFSSNRSTTERSASPGVLRRMHNSVAMSFLPSTQGWVVYHICRLALGCRAVLLSRSSRRNGASGSHGVTWSSTAACGEVHWLLQPLRLQCIASAHPHPDLLHRTEGTVRCPGPLPDLLLLRRESVAEACTACTRMLFHLILLWWCKLEGYLLLVPLFSKALYLDWIRRWLPLTLTAHVSLPSFHFHLACTWQYFFCPAKHPSLYLPIYHTNISAPFYCTTLSNQQKAQKQ